MTAREAHSDLVFRRYGRTHHVRIGSADDLDAAVCLDEAIWVATDAPISGFACDETFLKLLDADGNGRVICDELRDAVHWATHILTDRSDLSAGQDRLRLYTVDTSHPDGHRIVTSSRKILRRLGVSSEELITLQQVREIKARVQAQPISEAGVVLPTATDDPAVRGMLESIVAATGGAEHPSGQPGVDEAQLTAFLDGAKASLDWYARGDLPSETDSGEDRQRPEVLPLGEATADAYDACQAIAEKLEQFFAQCEAVRFDARLAERIALSDADLAERHFDDPEQIQAFLRDAPLAPPTPDAVLRYNVPNNPYYVQLLRRFDRSVVEPILGGPRDAVSWQEWDHIKRTLQPYADWLQQRPAEAYLALGRQQLGEYLQDERVERIRRLIAESADTAFEMGNIRLVEKLILFQANLIRFANSFISFPNLYNPTELALFERGTLVIDSRRLTLAVDVPNRSEHIKMAEAGRMFVIYVEVLRGEERRELCLPVTHGGRGNIVVGKRGVFIDRDGRQWDARIVHIIENPVSLGEALMAPFKRIGSLISGKIDSLTAEAEQKLDATTTAALNVPQTGPAAPAAPQKSGLFAAGGGLLMGGGVALAALGSSIAYMTDKFVPMHWLDILGGVGIILGVAVLIVAIPTLISAKLRLRKRDLSAILEGSGWAVNARMRLTRRQCRTFTHRPSLPAGARGATPRWRIVVALILLAAFALSVGAFLKYSDRSPLRRDEAPREPATHNDAPEVSDSDPLVPSSR